MKNLYTKDMKMKDGILAPETSQGKRRRNQQRNVRNDSEIKLKKKKKLWEQGILEEKKMWQAENNF